MSTSQTWHNRHLPQEILLNSSNGIDSSNIRLNTKNLQPKTSPLLNHLVSMIRILRRDRVWLPLDIRRDILYAISTQ